MTTSTIPQFKGPRPEGAVPIRRIPAREAWTLSRRRLIGGAMAIGTIAGLSVLGVLPPLRKAYAGGGYDIRETCGTISSGPGTCNVPCGDSDIHVNACEPSGPHAGFHKDSGIWDLRPGECYPGTNAWDGWKWQVPDCEGCHPRTFRCHDGWHSHSSPGAHDHRSVCLHRLSCG